MKTIDEAIKYAKEGVESLGAIIVDISTYPATIEFPESPFDVVIIAAYVPGKACLFTVDMNVKRGKINDTNIKFTIDGELNSSKSYDSISLTRFPTGSETCHEGCFSINDYTFFGPRENNIQKNIQRGTKFFKLFLENYGNLIVEKFSRSVFIWYVPEYSNALIKKERRNGERNCKNYKQFNAKVLAKFPRELFASDQRF